MKNDNSVTVDFFVPGYPRCGTGSMVANLQSHPEIWMVNSDTKKESPYWSEDVGLGSELHYFSDKERFRRGKEWYLSFFQMADEGKMIGEKSPTYLNPIDIEGKNPIEWIHSYFPNTKLVVCVREPVARTYSHWYAFRQSRRSFEADMERLLFFGRYIEGIEKILSLFPKENLHISICEKLKSDAKNEYKKVFRFLGVDENGDKESKVDNPLVMGAVTPDGYGPSEEEACYLRDYFKPFNERLFDFLGYEIKEWNSN